MQTEKNIWLKVLSMILTLALLISCVPNQVYAMAGEALADLQSVEDIDHIRTLFPQIAGVMIGRGLLARPSLAAQWRNNEPLSQEKDAELLLQIHDKIYQEYLSTLCGDSQILSKIKPYWDYAQSVIERRIWKAIHKSTTLQRYHQAIAPLR